MDATNRGLSVLFLVFSLGFLGACNQEPKFQDNPNCISSAVPQSYLVRWNGQVPKEFETNRLYPGSLVTRFTGLRANIEKTVLAAHPNEYLTAESDYQINTIHDESLPQSTVTTNMTASAWGFGDIETSQAWSYLNTQGAGVTVAVVDSGVDANHPLLQGQIASGGKSLVGNPNDLSDGANHGTHVSGIIAGLSDPASGFQGIAPGAKILPVKFINSQGAGSVGDAISATAYAISSGAKVINASWGGSQCSSTLQQEIFSFVQSGTVFVNAAGNDGQNISIYPSYPAVYQAPGKITVGSYNNSEILSGFSNYGPLVDLAAPGEIILSTVPPSPGQPEGQLGIKSGTSMATPFVAGVAALLLAAKPTATPAQIVAALDAGVVLGHFGVRTGGHLDAYLAAQYLMTH